MALAMGAVSISGNDKFDCRAFCTSYSCLVAFLASYAAGEKGDVVSDLELFAFLATTLHHSLLPDWLWVSLALGLGCDQLRK